MGEVNRPTIEINKSNDIQWDGDKDKVKCKILVKITLRTADRRSRWESCYQWWLHTYHHQVTPPATSQIISSHPSVFAIIFLLATEICCELLPESTEWQCLCEVWIFTSPDQKITVESWASFLLKQGSPGGDYRWWLVLVVAWLLFWPRSCENVPTVSQSSRWRGDYECNALSCYNDHNTTTTTTSHQLPPATCSHQHFRQKNLLNNLLVPSILSRYV